MDQKALHKISYGLYIVSSKDGNNYNGQISNTATQVAATPPIMTVALNKENLTHEYVEKSGLYTVSILNQNTPIDYIAHFGFKSGRDFNKFENINYKLSSTEVPFVLDHSIGYVSLEVEEKMDAYTHTIFKGKIIDAEVFSNQEALTYAYYHQIKKGTTPKNAPIQWDNESIESNASSPKYKCEVCGYIYDPAKGDGKNPPMDFDQLPDDWTCPICNSLKCEFEQIS